jgi:hypothetical protein
MREVGLRVTECEQRHPLDCKGSPNAEQGHGSQSGHSVTVARSTRGAGSGTADSAEQAIPALACTRREC